MASHKDEIVEEVARLLAERETLASNDWDAVLADLRQLADEYTLARDTTVCDELFATTADAFHLGMLVGEAFPKQTPPDAITGFSKPARAMPPLPAVAERPGPHADDWRKPLQD